jgi:hypothetical protein
MPRNTLLYALPELAAIDGHPHPLVADAAGQPLLRYLQRRYACVLCTAARGVRSGPVGILTLDDRSVCVRHRRWIGSRSMPDHTEQTDISGLPDMVTAHTRHRSLVRRYGRARTQQRYLDALDILRFWAVRGYWARARHVRMTRLCGREVTRIAPADPLLDLVIYPEVVGLTGIIASPFWRDFYVEQVYWHRRGEQRLFTEINDRLGFVGYRFEQASDPLLRYLDRVAVSARARPAVRGEARWLESA